MGTAHAWNAAQQWNKDSSLAQVLLSIQTQILGVNDPYFSEGFGHGNTKGTQAGEEASARYNNHIRLATLRHAIINHLKSPPRGFEEVTIRHFSMCRKRLLVQCRRWMMESRGTPIEKKFERAYATLVKLLCSDRIKEFTGYNENILPPLKDDMEFLRRLDPNFVQTHLVSISVTDAKPPAVLLRLHGDRDETPIEEEDQKPAAVTGLDPNLARAVADMIGTQALIEHNPWARISGSNEAHSTDDDRIQSTRQFKANIADAQEGGNDDDDEMYE